MKFVTLIIPYYRNPAMLAVQLRTVAGYSATVKRALTLVIVDDASPEEALPIVQAALSYSDLSWPDVQLYRIQKDIPWNRNGARNLGAHVATTDWLMHIDIDHVLPADAADALIAELPTLNSKHWYRFRRFRNGRADETRNKDDIPRDQVFGEIKPHGDSYLCTRTAYWKAGGYNEDFSGCLGGGSPFQRELEKVSPSRIAPKTICLHVYTRDTCPDASDNTLSRDTSEYARRRKALERAGKIKGHNPLRFPWVRVL